MNQLGRRILAVGTALLVLLLVNLRIAAYERTLAEGRVFYLQLAPVDPRSMLQGDYMALNFDLANQLAAQLSESQVEAAEGLAELSLDGRGVATGIRLSTANEAASESITLRYRRAEWRVHLVSDAWFFEEGQAARFEGARYGQFRSDGHGRALLVALTDDELRPL